MNSSDSFSLAQMLADITPCDERYTAEAQRHLDDLTKPVGSLGRLEAIAAQMFTIFSGKLSLPLRRGSYCFAADHGVADEGVSAYPREVTAQMVLNCLHGGAAISVLSRCNGVELTVVDVGVDAGPHGIEACSVPDRLAQAFGEPALHEIHQRIEKRKLGAEAFGRQPAAEAGA